MEVPMMTGVLNAYVLVKLLRLQVAKTASAYLNAKGNLVMDFWCLLGNQKGNRRAT